MELKIPQLPKDLHERFKDLCERERISMTEKMVNLIREVVRQGASSHGDHAKAVAAQIHLENYQQSVREDRPRAGEGPQ